MFMDRLEILKEIFFQGTQCRGDHLYLKEVTLGLSGKRTGVELPSLIPPVLVDHSEDCWTTMGCTTWGIGTGRN